MVNDLKKFFDKTFGPPGEALKAFKDISQAVSTLDETKLHLLRETLETAAKVKGSPEELQALLELFRLIASTDMEHLKAVESITLNLVKLAKLFPKGQLNVRELIQEMKK